MEHYIYYNQGVNMGITEFLATYITAIIDKMGYVSVAFFMTLESMIFPVPSEAIMPFAGFLVAEGKFSFALVVLFSTIGSIIGSVLSYVAGYFGGKPFVLKFGKYLLLNEHHLDTTEKYFNKYGEITIFVCRFIPIVRHLISIPAGVGKMNLIRFSVLTVIGAGMWNAFLTYVGMVLKQNWEEVMKYAKIIDIVVIVILVGLLGYFIYKQIKGRQALKRNGK
jgi:membrane protein DedA with SNARE-associated domain